MKKITLSILLLSLLLVGCQSKEKALQESMSPLKDIEYFDTTIKGEASIYIPDELLASPFEKEIANKAQAITYHIDHKTTDKLSEVKGDIVLGDSPFSFNTISNNDETLAFNGKGWFLFEDNPIKQNYSIDALHNFLNSITSNPELYSLEQSKQEIEFNEQKYTTDMIVLSFNKEGLSTISKQLGEDKNIENMKLIVFLYNDKPLVIQYNTKINITTAYNKDITAQLKGNILYNEINNPNTAVKKPEIGKRYDKKEDFLLDLLLK